MRALNRRSAATTLTLPLLLLFGCDIQPPDQQTPGSGAQPAADPENLSGDLTAPEPRRARRRRPRRGRRAGHTPSMPRKAAPVAMLDKRFPSPAGAPERVAIGDLDGDGKPEIVHASHRGLWITDAAGKQLATAKAWGHANALALGDPAGKDPGAIVVGWGLGRHTRKGPARVMLYRYRKGRLTEKELLKKESPKPLVTALAVGQYQGRPGVMVGLFVSKYNVQILHLSRQGAAWRTTKVEQIRMANTFAMGPTRRRGASELVVARAYGDRKGAPGDAFVWLGPGRRVSIPIQGGVRKVATVDLDGDGMHEVLCADGWAANYGRDARARLTLARHRKGAFHTTVVGELPGEYMINRILPVDLDGDRRPEIVVLGNRSVAVFCRKGRRAWTRNVLGATPMAQDLAVGDLDGDGRPEILVAGRRALFVIRDVRLP